MPAIRKGQLVAAGTVPQTPAKQFSALAAQVTESDNLARPNPKFATKPKALLWVGGTDTLVAALSAAVSDIVDAKSLALARQCLGEARTL